MIPYPLFAPLPLPFAEHIVALLQRHQRLPLGEAWHHFERELQTKRQTTYAYMDPFVRTYLAGGVKGTVNSFSTAWFLKALERNSPEKKPVPAVNLAQWQQRGVLRYREHGIPKPDNAAAFFIARLFITQQRKGFLPSRMASHEPDWWCWLQQNPASPPEQCPVPLPKKLPPEALLWTDWAGASWESPWRLIGRNRGAIRWAGIARSPLDGHIRWQVPPSSLVCWDPQLAPLVHDLPDERNQPIERQEMLHNLATLALQRLARSLLSSNDS